MIAARGAAFAHDQTAGAQFAKDLFKKLARDRLGRRDFRHGGGRIAGREEQHRTEGVSGALGQHVRDLAQARDEEKMFGRMAGAAGLEPATYGFGDRRSTN